MVQERMAGNCQSKCYRKLREDGSALVVILKTEHSSLSVVLGGKIGYQRKEAMNLVGFEVGFWLMTCL